MISSEENYRLFCHEFMKLTEQEKKALFEIRELIKRNVSICRKLGVLGVSLLAAEYALGKE